MMRSSTPLLRGAANRRYTVGQGPYRSGRSRHECQQEMNAERQSDELHSRFRYLEAA